MKICVTIDMDNYGEYRSLVDSTGAEAEASFYRDAAPRFLDLLDEHGVRATFFVIGRDAARPEHRKILAEMAARGHEIGNHSYTHPYNFRELTAAEKKAEIVQAEAAIADVVGERPVGFRTPSCDVDLETLTLLSERGYLYDSSIFPSPFMWAFMLYGKLIVHRSDYQLGHPLSVFAPGLPYVPSADRLHRPSASAGDGPEIVEIPISVVPGLRVPFYSTLLRLLGPRVFDLCVRTYGRRRSVLHMLFHLIELADLSETSLGRAMHKAPGLGVSEGQRQRFVSHSVGALARLGAGVPMREVAHEVLAARGRPRAVA